MACSGADTVVPIDTATNRARPAIRVGHRPTAIAATPDGRTVYVVNRHDSVTPIRTATNTALGYIRVGLDPDGIAMTADGRAAYVISGAVGNGAVVPGQVTFISTASDSVADLPGARRTHR